jgi:hypothetical protein
MINLIILIKKALIITAILLNIGALVYVMKSDRISAIGKELIVSSTFLLAFLVVSLMLK